MLARMEDPMLVPRGWGLHPNLVFTPLLLWAISLGLSFSTFI